MKFNRKVILEAVDAAIEAARKDHERREVARRKAHVTQLARWEKTHGENWDRFLADARRARAKKLPVTLEMFEAAFANAYYNNTLGPAAEFKPLPFEVPVDLRELKALLSACVDEIVDSREITSKRVLAALG